MTARDSTIKRRLRLGRLQIDDVTFEEALDAIGTMIETRRGGSVFTPNIDHVVMVDEDPRFCQAYEAAELSVVDGMPVLWASRLLGLPLPEKISGSDLVLPLMKRAEAKGWRVYLLGGAEGVPEKAAEKLRAEFPRLQIVGTDSPRIDMAQPASARAGVLAKVTAVKPDIVLVAFGAPKQELFIHEASTALRPAVVLGVGAGIDFIAGTVKRAPAWMSRSGLEWLYRLGKEPRRMWRRYLVRDPKFLLILLRDLRAPRTDRVAPGGRWQ
jgi:N-acetylglucosaminyldiphosphoundecaprenol N-acetyl-beta-D-mannosaminyltransferase